MVETGNKLEPAANHHRNHGLSEYANDVLHIVHRHGVKNVSKSSSVKPPECSSLEVTLIAALEFHSDKVVEAFATNPDYVPYVQARQTGGESWIQLVNDPDLAGTIPYYSI